MAAAVGLHGHWRVPSVREEQMVTVRDIIRRLEADGWVLVATRGSHRQYNRCRQAVGRVGAGHAEEYSQAGWNEGSAIMRYAVVIEKTDGNYSAFVPDLPGCIATGPTVEAVENDIRDAIRFHIEGLQQDGQPVPAPTSLAEYIET